MSVWYRREPLAEDDGLPCRVPAVPRIRQLFAKTLPEGKMDVMGIHSITKISVATRGVNLSEYRVGIYIDEFFDLSILFRFFESSGDIDKHIS
jgi:hypothetical protein